MIIDGFECLLSNMDRMCVNQENMEAGYDELRTAMSANHEEKMEANHP
jgi:hypothetical protein